MHKASHKIITIIEELGCFYCGHQSYMTHLIHHELSLILFLLYCTRLLKIKSCALFYVDRLFQEFIYLECAVIGNINLDKAAYCTPFPCDAKNNIIFKRVLNLLGGYRHR